MTTFDESLIPDFDTKTIPKPGDQHDPTVRAHQATFQERFGDFPSRHVVGLQFGPAPKGEWVGLIVELEDGSAVKAAIPFTLWQAFGNEYALAMMTAAEIVQMAYGPSEGQA
ncbi:hypothetical protein [Mesorhizobium kowhaii]|uniref:Uncharacterized protein n=1 Tax=Mesorhizobium kowhaii TaxID=1300272 RepID=A0A2W7C9H3_9HYPH|nr:hypothetical protein [Mesorhizobium kowhaii]PZV33373.1 hypothetical protein B5V02_39325 [Mesorhizobium kowhaii]